MNLDPFAMIESLQQSAREATERAALPGTHSDVALANAIQAHLLAALSAALIAGVKGGVGK